jgi:hypothetical protein
MLFGAILKKYWKPSDRKILLEKMIRGLSIDSTQKNLFLDSLELLDEAALESLYKKISNFVVITEEQNSLEKRALTQKVYSDIEKMENSEKKKTENSFNILLDSI